MISRNRFQFQDFRVPHNAQHNASEHDSIMDDNKKDNNEIACKCNAKFARAKAIIEPFILRHGSRDYAQLLEQVIESQDREAEKPISLNVTYNLNKEEGEKFSLTACKKSNKRKFDEFSKRVGNIIERPNAYVSQKHIKYYHPDLMNMINIDDIETVDGIPVDIDLQVLMQISEEDEMAVLPLDFQGFVRSFADSTGKINKLIFLHTFYSRYIAATNIPASDRLDQHILEERWAFLNAKVDENARCFFEDRYGTIIITSEVNDELLLHIFKLKMINGHVLTRQHKEILFKLNEGSPFQGVMSVGDIKKHFQSQIDNVDYFNNSNNFYSDLYSKSTDSDYLHEDHVYIRADDEQFRELPNLLHNDIIEE